MRVALAGAFPEREGLLRGGLEASAHALAGELGRRPGIDLHVVSIRRDGGSDETRRTPAYTLHLLAPANRLPFSLRVTGADPRRVRRVLEAVAPHVVHAHGIDAPALAAVTSRIPTLLAIHGIAHRDVLAEMRSPWDRVRLAQARRLERLVIPRATTVASTAPAYVERVYAPLLRGPVRPLDNPVPDAYFALPPAGAPGTVLFAGFVRRLKGVDVLLQAFVDVARAIPHATLRIAGAAPDPAYLASLEHAAARDGLAGRVVFLGSVPEDAMRQEYARAAVLCLPSRQENTPVAIQQAMAAGRPVVATRIAGIPGLVEDGVTGVLTAPDDPAATAAGLVRLLGDPALGARMGDAARQVAEKRFRVRAVVDRTIALYEETLATAYGKSTTRRVTAAPPA